MRADSSRWLPVVLDIARSHGLACASPHVFSTGTNLVVGLDEPLILKIFPPVLRGQFVSERGSLALLHGRLGVPIPEIVCEGERDQWPYLVITRVYGRLGAEVWPALPEDQKERVLVEIGEIIAEVQRVPLRRCSRLSRAGMLSCVDRSKAAGRGMCALVCPGNSSMGSTICCAMPPSSFHQMRRR